MDFTVHCIRKFTCKIVYTSPERLHKPTPRVFQCAAQCFINFGWGNDGETLFESVKAAGFEGIVSKRRNSRYVLDHRSKDWLKYKNYQLEEVAISGIRKNKFGWALQFDDGNYACVCEFVPPEARSVFRQISKQLVQSENQNWTYLEPLIRCRVKYQCLIPLRSLVIIKFC
jgi:hypothetical protein